MAQQFWPIQSSANAPLYVHTNNNKVPYSLTQEFALSEAMNWIDGAGIIIRKPYVVLDFDSMTHFNMVCKILASRGISTPIMTTDRGGHIWFKSTKQYSNKKHYLPILMECDIKSWGITADGEERKQFVVVKRNGVWRHWQNTVIDEEHVAEIPYWLEPKAQPWTKLKLEDDFDEGERNSNIFRLKIPLGIHYQFSEEQKKVILETINDFCLPQPLAQKEIDAMFRKGSTYDKELQAEYLNQFFNEGKFQHNTFGEYLKSENYIRKYKTQLWCFNESKYQRGEDKIRFIIRKMMSFLKTSQVNEVINYIYDTLQDLYDRSKIVRYIALNNCIYNTETKEVIGASPEIFTPISLNIDYDEDIANKEPEKCKFIQDVILDIMSNSVGQYKLLMEIFGYCLVPHTAAQKAFVFFGEGSNGKSIILEKLLRPLFDGYTASLGMQELNDRFKLGLLDGALVNIDADNSSQTIKDSSTFKKIATGDDITIDVKYGQPYTVANTCKLISCFNELPRSKDITDGFNRRILIVRFMKKYSVENGNLDPMLSLKIQENLPVIKSFIFNEIIIALKRLENNNWQFTQVETNMMLLKNFVEQSNSVKSWLEHNNIKEHQLYDWPVDDSYISYSQFCEDDGCFRITKNLFSKRLRTIYNLDTKTKSVNGLSKKVFIKKVPVPD